MDGRATQQTHDIAGDATGLRVNRVDERLTNQIGGFAQGQGGFQRAQQLPESLIGLPPWQVQRFETGADLGIALHGKSGVFSAQTDDREA